MTKDDFFVIAYKILAYLYACLKAGEDPKLEEISDSRLNIPERYWYSIITMLYREGYIEGMKEINTVWMPETYYSFDRPTITVKGIEYLEDNSMMKKARDALKELKAMVPGL
ncbi:MAG: YjcQ family protein [Lachnospiraceae bacterium]|nr:YjcQ family protein [Lachnospiraceae bacterium]